MTLSEIFRYALLMTLVLMLAYILYKRMLLLFRKQNVQSATSNVECNMEWIDARHANIQLSMKHDEHLKLEICNHTNAVQMVLTDAPCQSGPHQFKLDVSALATGRYYLKLTTQAQSDSQYFNVS
ncbi:MAG: hypothetical protein ACKVOR_01540 [Flavobacteriales bacterium]